jgi:hypothetical protein
LFWRAEPDREHYHRQYNMKPGVGRIVGNQVEDHSSADNEAHDRYDRVNHAKIWNHKRAALAPDIEASRKTMPEAMWTTLCAVLTMKMSSNIGIPSAPVVVMPGTNPRMPTARKTIPKSIPNVLAICDLLLGEKKLALWQSQFLLARKIGISSERLSFSAV